jgi:predicted glycosyltransferase involved in capsule biosynthesis
MEIAKGDIFLFMDSDCYIQADALEKAVQITKKHIAKHSLIHNSITNE